MTKDPAIALRDISFAWPGSLFEINIPHLDVARGETMLLLGESGSGKSTLLSLIAGIVLPSKGKIRVAGVELTSASGPARDRLRANEIGVVFQMFNLLPFASGLDNILLGTRFAPERTARCTDPRAEALQLASDLGLAPDIVTNGTAGQLSVGQQQRIAAARAMIGNPALVLADEPTSALDAASQRAFLDLMFDRLRHAGSALLMVSHDHTLADRFDRVVELGSIARTMYITAQ